MLTPIIVGVMCAIILLPVWVCKVVERRKRSALPAPRVPHETCDATKCGCSKRALTLWEQKEFQLRHHKLRSTMFDPVMRVQVSASRSCSQVDSLPLTTTYILLVHFSHLAPLTSVRRSPCSYL